MILKREIGKMVSKAAAWLFVFSYTSALFLVQFHQLSHQPEAEEVLCYEEENACHLRLVHLDLDNGCDHESHFSDEQPTCDLCPLLQAKTEASEKQWQLTLTERNTIIVFGEVTSFNYQNYSLNLSTRGPPLNS